MVQNEKWPLSGLNTTSDSPENLTISATRGTESGTPDSELAEVVGAWPVLPDNARARILALVRTTGAS
jgi:hypothetical protein